MTVKELIEALKKLPQDAEVLIDVWNPGVWDATEEETAIDGYYAYCPMTMRELHEDSGRPVQPGFDEEVWDHYVIIGQTD